MLPPKYICPVKNRIFKLAAIFSALLLLPSCVMENRGGGHYVLRAKTGQEYRHEGEMKQKALEYAKRTGSAPSLAGKTYKVLPSGRMMAGIVKFHSGGRLTFSEDGYKGVQGAAGEWKQDGNAMGFVVNSGINPTFLGRIRGEQLEGVVANDTGYSGEFTGFTGSLLAANQRAEEEQARRDLVQLNNQVESVKGFFRDALTAPPSGGGGTGGQNANSAFNVGGYNDMTVTYDKLAGSAPIRGTNTIHVRLGSHAYALTYDFAPGSYLLDGGGDLTGSTVNVKFEGGRPVTAKNYQRGDGYVTINSWKEL